MARQRIFHVHLDAVARPRVILAGGIDHRDVEIVLAIEHTGHRLARWQSHGYLFFVPLGSWTETGHGCRIQKGGLQIGGLVLGRDVRQIASRRVAHFAPACAVEIRFAGLRISVTTFCTL